MRSTPLSALILATSLSACKVVDAPTTLESMMVFGFVNTTNDAEITVVAEELPPLVKKHLVDLEDGYRVDSLRRKNLVEAGVDPGEVDQIVGAMGHILYTNEMDGVLDAITSKHRDQIAENTTEYEVLDDTDRACFLARECEDYHLTARQVTKQALIGNVTQTFSQDFRWVETEDGEAVASRVLAPDPVDVSSGLAAVDQQYSFFLLRPQPKGGTERTEAIWAEARLLGADLPDSFLVDNAVRAMGDQAEKVDAWLDAK